MNETEKKRYDEIQRSVNPKTKVRRCYKIEEDGSKTTVRVIDLGYKAVFHNKNGPALISPSPILSGAIEVKSNH